MSLSTLNESWNGKVSVTSITVIASSTLAIYNAVELFILISTGFKRWHGLYFWSILVSSIGVFFYSIGFLLEYFITGNRYAGDIVNNLGWSAMVTGQSVVLYSRLHLVLNDLKLLRAILWMIIIDALLFHIPTTAIHFGAYSGQRGFYDGSQIIEKIQMTGFCIQEFVISGLYMREIWRILKIISQPRTRQTMWHLFNINLLIVTLDIGLLITEYLGLRIFEQTFKGVVYSIKLKLEFAVLSKLVSIVCQHDRIYIVENGNGPHPNDSCSQQINMNLTPVSSVPGVEILFAEHIEMVF